MDLEKRIEELEKRVATLEGQVQEQLEPPKVNNRIHCKDLFCKLNENGICGPWLMREPKKRFVLRNTCKGRK